MEPQSLSRMVRAYISREVKARVLDDVDAGMRPCEILAKYGFKNFCNVNRILKTRSRPSRDFGPNDQLPDKLRRPAASLPSGEHDLRKLALAGPKKRLQLLEDSKRSLIKQLSRVAQDILSGKTPVSGYQHGILQPYADRIRELADPETSSGRKRKQLIASSDFLPALLYKTAHG
jgi:hypothetical protein